MEKIYPRCIGLWMASCVCASLLAFGAADALAAEFQGSISTKGVKERQYHQLAKVSPEEAMAKAKAQVPGAVTKLELDSERGYLVYEVDIVQEDNTKMEVLVDAGDGSILYEKKD